MNKQIAAIGALFTILLFTILLFTTHAFAQSGKFRGIVKYKIEWKGEVGQGAPTTLEVKVWDNSTSTPSVYPIIERSLTNGDVPVAWVLIDFSTIPLEGVQGKWYIKKSKKEIEEDISKTTYTYLDEKKEIAGKQCQKVHVVFKGKDSTSVEEEDIWVCPDFGPEKNIASYPGLKGMPFEYPLEISESLSGIFTVQEIIEGGKVKETDVLLPTGYEEITKEEFEEMMKTLMEAFGGGAEEDI